MYQKDSVYKISILLVFTILSLSVFSQKHDINPNGYNIFYNENGKISSEGNFKDGQPSGYWKSYYSNGILKTEGFRNGGKLDSIWKFYDDQGNLEKQISYQNGKKNGYYLSYSYSKGKQILISKEIFLDDLKNGASEYYNENGSIKSKVNYESGLKTGEERLYDSSGNIYAIIKYIKGNIADSEYINRFDNSGRKQGTSKEFFDNDRLKITSNYTNDLLNGYYREYDKYGQLIKSILYSQGSIVTPGVDVENPTDSSKVVEKKEVLFSNGTVKEKRLFRDGKPYGTHYLYDESGNLEKAEVYSNGELFATGIIDEKGLYQGEWTYFYQNGNTKQKGNYTNGKKQGEWQYYFETGELEQKGNYKTNRTSGNWTWYYIDGTVRRTGEFERNSESGFFVEYSNHSDTLSVGHYESGYKTGEWRYYINDIIEIGSYKNDLKNGIWKQYYKSGELMFQGEFIDGEPHGEHLFYYKNSRIKEQQYYELGIPSKRWITYDDQGFILCIKEFRSGLVFKIDGYRVKDNESD